jgi:hypothetical protein
MRGHRANIEFAEQRKASTMPRDTNVPRFDPADNDDLRAIANLMGRLSARRVGASASYEDQRRADFSVLADAMWLREEAQLRSLVTTTKHIEVDGLPYKALEQESSATYHGLWGTHVVEEDLYRQQDVRNGNTIKPLSLRVGAIGNLLPDAARTLGLLRASMTSVEMERTLSEMGFRPPSRAYIEKRVSDLAHEMDQRIVVLEAACRDAESASRPVAFVSCGADRFATRMDEPLPEGTERKGPRRKKPYERTPPPPAEHNWRMSWCGSMTEYDEDGLPIRTLRYGADCARSPEEMAQIRTRLLSAMRMAMRKERNHLHAEGARLDALAEALDETGS